MFLAYNFLINETLELTMTLMGTGFQNQWSTVFCGIVSRALTLEVLSTGIAGNYNGALQVVRIFLPFSSTPCMTLLVLLTDNNFTLDQDKKIYLS